MKTCLIKFLYGIIISGISISKLHAQAINSDSTKLIASISKKEVDYKSSIIPANIIFPSSLDNYKEQSLDYIEKYSAKKRDFLLSTYETGKKYFPKIISVLKKYHLPEELKVLIALESGFRGNVVSKAGAVGYWQLMANVAQEYGLQITTKNDVVAGSSIKKDERKNFSKSTLVAVKYLHAQKLPLNSELLFMVASYNCGMGNVKKAIKRSGKLTPDFWDIKKFLPVETRNFVMNFIALNVLLHNYENFEKRKLIFTPKIINLPFENPESNSSTPPIESVNID